MPFMAKYDPFSPTLDHPLLNSSPDYNTKSNGRNGSLRSRALGNGTFSHGSFTTQLSYRERSKRLRDVEDEKQQLIEELIYNLESCESQLQQLRLERERESQYYNDGQLRENTLQEQLKRTQEIINRNSFIVALIDGDDALFPIELYSKGEQGGKDAAALLSTAMADYATENVPHIDNAKTFVRVYANTSNLCDMLLKVRIIDRPTVLTEFIRGFNGSSLRFDFVDVGRTKNTVSDKIIEMIRSNLNDCHCHQVMLGCSTKKYAGTLEEIAQDSELVGRLVLLDGVQHDKEITALSQQLRTTSFGDVLSSCKPRVTPTFPKPPPGLLAAMPALAKVDSNTTNGTTSPGSGTPRMNWAAVAVTAQVPPPPPMLARPENLKPARTPTPGSSVSLETKPKGSNANIDRNRAGHRVDRTDTAIPNYEVQRVKKLKLCNVYYLQSAKDCSASHCSHRHDYPISNYERKILREVARMTPCYYKFDCDDSECIYGHRCPQSKPGEQGCYYGDDCRFYGWGHGIDTRIVKTTKV